MAQSQRFCIELRPIFRGISKNSVRVLREERAVKYLWRIGKEVYLKQNSQELAGAERKQIFLQSWGLIIFLGSLEGNLFFINKRGR